MAPNDLSFMSSPLFVVCCRQNLFLNLFVEKKSFSFERKDELKVNETANK
jgi:hypothetical protein